MNLVPEIRIEEEEIVLNPIDRAIALDEYLPGGYFGLDAINPVNEVTIFGQKVSKNIIWWIIAVLVIIVLGIIYWRVKK